MRLRSSTISRAWVPRGIPLLALLMLVPHVLDGGRPAVRRLLGEAVDHPGACCIPQHVWASPSLAVLVVRRWGPSTTCGWSGSCTSMPVVRSHPIARQTFGTRGALSLNALAVLALGMHAQRALLALCASLIGAN